MIYRRKHCINKSLRKKKMYYLLSNKNILKINEFNMRMIQNMQAIGIKTINDMAMGYRSGRMGLSIWDIGIIIWLVAMVRRFMLMEIFMKVTGKRIRLMAKANIRRQIILAMQDNGKTIYPMGKVLRLQEIMKSFIKEHFLKVKNLVREN